MSVTVRYFAVLRERMGRAQETIEADRAGSVAEVWARVSGGQPLPGNLRVAVNHEYVEPAHVVRDGDEVAFFPPVTGG